MHTPGINVLVIATKSFHPVPIQRENPLERLVAVALDVVRTPALKVVSTTILTMPRSSGSLKTVGNVLRVFKTDA